MPWFKVDDTLAFNAKVVGAGNDAMGLWVRAGSWCASQLQDGFVPSVMANAMANGQDVDALVSCGLWDEVDGGYQFHDWEEYQPSARDVKDRRKARSQAGKLGAASRWGMANDEAGDKANAMASAMANGCPVPSRPVPSSSTSELRSDVAEILDHLDRRILANGAKKPGRTKGNADAARLLIDRDGKSVDEIRHVIDWATSDDFWKPNILSMSKLRAKFDQLALKASVSRKASGRGLTEWEKGFTPTLPRVVGGTEWEQ